MKPYSADKVLALGLLIALASGIGCNGIGAQPPVTSDNGGSPPFSKSSPQEISKGTAIYIRLQQSICSSTAQSGDHFSAVLDEPLVLSGRVVAPAGAEVKGRVVAARKSGSLRNSGYLRVTLAAITVDGKEVPIHTTSMFVEGGRFNNRNLVYVGGGTGSGALIGALANGSKKTVIGSMAGTEGGTAAYATDKQEVGFAAERRMGFRLIEALNIS
ncbi:MAG TPA: hypothetical protein VKD65_14895 [Candidatus Angelobacter sp.]|nr:hypothetical protein [Candidatus Angelobacter sp.]